MSAGTVQRTAQQAAEDDIELRLLWAIQAAGEEDHERFTSLIQEALVMTLEGTLRHPYLRKALLHEVLAVERGDF